MKEKNEALTKETTDLKQENQYLKSLLNKNCINTKENKEKNINQSKISIGATTECEETFWKLYFIIFKFIDYKTSNAETLSTNDQSVFESHHSLAEKPIYSYCKKDENFRKYSYEQEKVKGVNVEPKINFQKHFGKAILWFY